ncbi:MAG TPA: DUF1343 domain-containing protein [Calditrichia bacterium]|nr:DUF1343 domain-containing protein [Calditrichota bacterium]HQU71686.1 DUF1343 domain-containing protein [Calditrichia bacterium]HQV31271.1 DUF1343 domain-containing protein [Calditrichia bacterium]
MSVQTGLDGLAAGDFNRLAGRNVALLCNQASIAADLQHAVDLFYKAHRRGRFTLKALLGPQHGLWGHTQDNMIEWEGYRDPRLDIPVFSLYGEHRKPNDRMLADVDILVCDLQDVGAKYYTFIWSMAHCMEACAERGIEVLVLDRPNPIGGLRTEGPWENAGFESFVGLHPLPVRHGMTIAEIATYLRQHYYPDCELSVETMSGWDREMYFADTGLPWAMPSPNVPVAETTIVYPGMCLLEATNLSEGRGTTRPFDIFGAPWLDGWKLAKSLSDLGLPGVAFRALEFQPTFQKHAGKICQGCFIHVTNSDRFKPYLTTIALLKAVREQNPEAFAWNPPPYEYEYQKLPIDILNGNDWIRKGIDEGRPLIDLEQAWAAECAGFTELRREVLLYR